MSEGLPDFTTPGQARDLTMARFYLRPLHNKAKSDAAGRPIFDDVEYVEIIIPGNRGTTVDERAKDEHRQRWPAAYKAYLDGKELAQEGTPLEEWPGVMRSQVEELKFFNVRTVETLAALDDMALSKAVPMGGQALREKAKRWLAEAGGSAIADRLAAENRAKDETIEAMKEQIASLSGHVERLLAQGRPQPAPTEGQR